MVLKSLKMSAEMKHLFIDFCWVGAGCGNAIYLIEGSTCVQIIYAMSHVTFYFPYVPMSLFIRPWRPFLQFL